MTKPMPRLVVYDVVLGGTPVRDVSHLDATAVLTRKREVEERLAQTRGDASRLDERQALKHENQALDARLRDLKETQKAETTRRNFAGIGSPLHEALVERLVSDHGLEGSIEIIAELERVALEKFAERERRNAERKAKKTNP